MKNIILVFATVASIFVVSCNSNSTQQNFKSEKESVTVLEASAMLKDNSLLIDVREPNEIAEHSFDVKNSINIPLDSIESKMNSIPKNIQVILICNSGNRSSQAYAILVKKGFTNLANMEGGMKAWSEAGLPTKTGIAEKKACCANPNSKNCNPDGTCKTKAREKDKCCSDKNSAACEDKKDCKYDANGKCIGYSKNCCAKTETKTSSTSTTTKNYLEVFAFHGTRQCETCKHMKAYTKETLDNYFSEQLKNGSIVFSIIDVDDAANEQLAEKFQATGTALMINNVVNGKDNITDWSDFAFEKANDASKFIPELKAMINEALIKQNGNTSSIH